MYDEDTKLELVAFILNKNNVCKNQNCVIENGILAWINNDSNNYCITITIYTKELPFYCQKVSIFAYNVNKLCSNTVKHPALKGKAWVKSSSYLIYSKGRGEFHWNVGVFR